MDTQSIFTPYLAHVLSDCCQDLLAASEMAQQGGDEETSSSSKRKRSKKMADPPPSASPELRWRRSAVARVVLSGLRRCFQSDRSDFVNKARFELIMPAVVSQLECGADYVDLSTDDPSDLSMSEAGESGSSTSAIGGGEVAACRRYAEEFVGPCLAQLASVSAKDALWKALVNAVLLKTRSTRAAVRVAALVSLRQCFEVVGEEFLALLPECIPFLSELLEVRGVAFRHT